MASARKSGKTSLTPMMAVDLRGRIKNAELPTSRPLLPLFESIVNSLQSLDVAKPKKPRITVHVLRDAQGLLHLDPDTLPPPSEFKITDNGTGFNEENFTSFLTSDSTYKESIGGKRVGRFTWLKAFEEVRIDSIYAADGKKFRRTFRFTATGIEDHDVAETARPPSTCVHIIRMRQRWQKYCPKKVETIAYQLIQHIMSWFVGRKAPSIVVTDGVDTVELRDIWEKTYRGNFLNSEFEIADTKFVLHHLKLYNYVSSSDEHSVHFCAHGRDVMNTRIADLLPSLPSALADEHGDRYLWKTYVTSKYLDECVSAGRTSFELPEDSTPLFSELSLGGIKRSITKNLEELLGADIARAAEANRSRVERYIAEQAPVYRSVMHLRPEAIEKLPSGLSDEKLDVELHKISYEIERSHRARTAEVLDQDELQLDEYTRLVLEGNELGKSALAKYIASRRWVLDMFNRALRSSSTESEKQKYALEEAVHRLIFPLKADSDEVRYEDQNLWIIDERLNYHYYLASDKPFSSMKRVELEDDQRPDIIVFNRSYALAEGDEINSVVIIEFKRPMRTSYNVDDDNPISQVLEYVQKIRDGKAKDRHGRPIAWKSSMPFYCHVIADLTRKLKTICQHMSLVATPDGEGFYGYNQNYGAYLEVFSYAKIYNDARKRNRFFFDKLKLQ